MPAISTSGDKRRAVFKERDGERCYYCGSKMRFNPALTKKGRRIQSPNDATIEHVIARSEGGVNALSNCVLAHRACNMAAGSMSVEAKFALRTAKATERWGRRVVHA